MGLIATVKRWIYMIFKNRAEKDFDVKDITSPAMEECREAVKEQREQGGSDRPPIKGKKRK